MNGCPETDIVSCELSHLGQLESSLPQAAPAMPPSVAFHNLEIEPCDRSFGVCMAEGGLLEVMA